MSELTVSLPLIIVVLAAVTGAVLNVIRHLQGSWNEFSPRKFVTSIIVAVMAVLALDNLANLANQSTDIVILAITGLVSGFTADFTISRGKKD